MATNSDLDSKYNRLCGEFNKLREKHKALKEGVLKERSKTAKLQEQVREKDISLRKLSQERESLVFRNDHLTKQISFLRDELEAERSEKKSKSKRHGNKHSGGHLSANSGDLAVVKSENDTALEVLSEELQLKIEDCSRLHTQMSEQTELHNQVVESLKKEIQEKIDELQRCMENQQSSEKSLQAELQTAKEERVAAEVQLAVQERDMKQLNNKYKQLYNEFENYKQDVRYKRSAAFSENSDQSGANLVANNAQNLSIDEEVTDILQLEKCSLQEYENFLSELVRMSSVMLDCCNQSLQKFKKRLTFFHQSITGSEEQKSINEFIANLSDSESFVKELSDKVETLPVKCGQSMSVDASYFRSICDLIVKIKDYLSQTFLPNLKQLFIIENSRYSTSSTFLGRQNDIIDCLETFITRLVSFNNNCLLKMNFRTPKEFAENFAKQFDGINSSIRDFARLTNNKVSLEQEFLKSCPKEKAMNNELAHSLVNFKAKFDCISTFLSKNVLMLMLYFDSQNKSLNSKRDSINSPAHRPDSREDVLLTQTSESSNGAHLMALNSSLSGADELSTGLVSCSMSRVSSPSIGGEINSGINDRRINSLIDRITILEKDNQDLALKFQISEKRRQKEKAHCTYLETILQSKGLQYDLSVSSNQSTNSSSLATQCNNDNIDHESDREKLVKQFYTKQLADLSQNLHKMLSRVLIYHDECKILHYRLAIKEAEVEKMSLDISQRNGSIQQLKDDLELTQNNYSKQISQMSEHIAALNYEIEEERKQFDSYRSQQNPKRGFLGIKKS